jgi:hypothetical protein
LIGIAIVAVVAIAIPLVVSANLGGWDKVNTRPDAIWQTAMDLLAAHWMLLVYLLLIASAVLTFCMAVHGAVEAGSARVYLEAERAGAISTTPTRERFEVFKMETFLAGAREGWWRVFWIYNIAWFEALLVILMPLLLGAVLIVAIGANAASLVLGCLILLVMTLVFFCVTVLTNLWVQKAIVAALARGLGAREALLASRRQIGGDFARHAGLALIMIGVAIAGSAALSSFSSGLPIHGGDVNWQLLFLSPIAIGSSILNTAFSAGVASWFLACVAAIHQENPA